MNKKKSLTQCAYCKSTTCYPLTGINESMPPIENAPVSCPMRRHEEVVRQAGSVYHRTNIREFARLASVQEAECYESGSNGLKTRIPRIEETTEFAAKCGYFRLGLAFCLGLRTEAAKVSRIFEAKGFEVASVCCKVGRTPKESLGISGEEKIRGADCMESMCNPVAQAHLLNTQQVDLAVMLGLCVGHDTLFLKYCQVPCTVLAVKDRVTGHNPLAAVYLSESPYYGRLKNKAASPIPGSGWKKVDITAEE